MLRLDQMLSCQHKLYCLADQTDWSSFEIEFGPVYSVRMGRPSIPIRLLVGLHSQKHAFNESDKSVVFRFIEKSYWQYFCGFEFFQHRLFLDLNYLSEMEKTDWPQWDREAAAGHHCNRCMQESAHSCFSWAGQCRPTVQGKVRGA